VLALVLFTVLFATGGGRATTAVDSVVAGSPAARAGLEADDRILAIDGRGKLHPWLRELGSLRETSSAGQPWKCRVFEP
jgi:S1-C subfamily serine protease